jgi:hypothetical protein
MFFVLSSASGPVFMFCVLESFSTIPRATSSVFTYIMVPRSSGPAFMFYAPGLVFGGTERVRSRFHVLRSRTYFWQNHGHRVSFSCFAHPDSFSAVPRASGPVFMFCAPILIFGGTEDVQSCFHVLRSWTHFRRYRRLRVPFSCFARPDSFSTETRVPGCCFHVLRSRTCFLRCRVCRVPFSCFVCPDSFSTVLRATGSVFMFFAMPRASCVIFMFCAPRLIFGRTGRVRSRFHVLRSQTCFWQYRGHRVSFSCFARPDSFLAVPTVSAPVYMFCAPGLVFGGTERVGSRFRWYRGRRVPFSCFAGMMLIEDPASTRIRPIFYSS